MSTKSRTATTSCKCFARVDELLKPLGAMLNQNLFDRSPRAFIAVIENGDKRKRGQKLPLMQASYCPFCGKKYPKETDRTVTSHEASNTGSVSMNQSVASKGA
jgi:hypothetical protein